MLFGNLTIVGDQDRNVGETLSGEQLKQWAGGLWVSPQERAAAVDVHEIK
jgi:hypothetical protein